MEILSDHARNFFAHPGGVCTKSILYVHEHVCIHAVFIFTN